MKPYDIYQGSIFLPYLRRTRGLTDFLPAAARARSAIDGNPPYEGDLACPTILPGQAATPTPAFLRTTYGQAAIFATRSPGEIGMEKVSFGKNDWLFLDHDTNNVMAQHRGELPMTEDML
jgi:hypothetical protein